MLGANLGLLLYGEVSVMIWISPLYILAPICLSYKDSVYQWLNLTTDENGDNAKNTSALDLTEADQFCVISLLELYLTTWKQFVIV